MKPRLRNFFWLNFLCCFIFAGAAFAADAPTGDARTEGSQTNDTMAPEAVVAKLETTLIENMKAGDAMDFEDRFEVLRPLLDEIMAVDRMGRYLFGRDWASFEPAQRESFRQAFLDLSAATYAGQFKAFGGESFDPVGVQQQSEDRAVVKRRLTTGSGRKIAFDYLMSREDSHWQIVTIITDGVSDLAIKRTQYRRILDSQDFDALVAHIEESIESQKGE